MLKLAIITGFLSRTKDRFHEYNQPLDLDGKFELMSQMEGFDGVEIVYPYEVNDVAATKAALDRYKLHHRETYNEVIARLIGDLAELDEPTRRELEDARRQLRRADAKSHEAVGKAIRA